MDPVAFCRPVFATCGDPVVHMGPLGTGQLANAFGRDLGVDPAALAAAVTHGSGAGFALKGVAAAGGTLDRIAAHAGPLLSKDVRLVTDVAVTAGAASGTVVAAADAALARMNNHHP